MKLVAPSCPSATHFALLVWIASFVLAPSILIAGPHCEQSLLRIAEGAQPDISNNIAMSRRAYDYGEYFWKIGDLQLALHALDAAIRFDPQYALAYAVRATVRSQRGDQQAALDDANRAIELDPKLAIAYYNRGVAYGRMHNWPAAAADYSEAVRLDPKLGGGHAYNNLGSALMAQGKYEEAIRAFSSAIELNPKAVVSYFNRSLAHERAGHLQEALNDHDSALALGARFKEADHRRAWLLIQQGHDIKAMTYWRSKTSTVRLRRTLKTPLLSPIVPCCTSGSAIRMQHFAILSASLSYQRKTRAHSITTYTCSGHYWRPFQNRQIPHQPQPYP